MFAKLSLKIKLIILVIIPPVVLLVPFILNYISWQIPLAVLVIGLFWFVLINNSILKPLNSIGSSIKRNRTGNVDLTQRLPVKNKDEISTFSRDFNIFIAQLHDIIFELKNIADISELGGSALSRNVDDIVTSVDRISNLMDEVESNSQNLDNKFSINKKSISEIKNSIGEVVNNINSQSTSVEQSSAAVEELISSITNISSISSKKITIVNNLLAMVKTGEDNMEATVKAIQSISSSAGVIRELIEVINGVAEQTNILAMNAAIEAAHAGEAGKGFGVVADEIRKLAETTSLNSSEISKNLNEIITNIEESAGLTARTDASIKDMTGGISDVADSMNEIITSMSEMSMGTKEMTDALTSLVNITSEVKHSSADIVEQSETVEVSMEEITQLSSLSNKSVSVMSSELTSINRIIANVGKMGSNNVANIEIMSKDIAKFKIIDTSGLKSSDGQALVQWNKSQKEIPARPDKPESYPDTDERRWYDLEFAGWNSKKVNLPDSRGDGALGKNIVLLQACDHPYHLAYLRGAQKIAKAYGVNLKAMNAQFSVEK